MTDDNKNGRYVTVSQLNDKLQSLRWELRAYVLLIVVGVLLRFQIPQTTAALVAHIL